MQLTQEQLDDIVISGAAHVARIVAENIQLPLAVKNINTLADTFEVRLSEAVADFFNRDKSAPQVASIMRQMLRSYAMDMYQEGMADGGIEKPEDELTDEDESTVSQWVTDQLSYVDDFISALKETRNAKVIGEGQDAINQRVTLWRGSLENLGSLGKASAQKNKMCVWVYGDTEHCTTCEKLNGKKHRLKWFIDNGYIPQENGSETLECGGWHCQCRLEDMEGEQVMP